jgi:polysaccharide biosynthesis transport protein
LDLGQLLGALRAHVRLIALIVLTASLSAFAISSSLAPVYEANVRLLVGQASPSGNPDYNLLLASQRLSQTYAELAVMRPTAERVKAKLGLSKPVDDILKDVIAAAEPDSLFVNIRAKAGTPQDAAALANAFADAVIAASPRIFVDTTATAKDLLTIVEPAVPPVDRAGPRVGLNTLIAAIAALLAGFAVAVIIERVDDRVKKPEDLESVVEAPTLATIGRIPARGEELYQLAAIVSPRSGVAESFRALRTNIGFAAVDTPIRTLVITSAMDRDGKTTVAGNLALVFAQAGNRTLLVDADLRRPSVHEFFRLPNDVGLTTLLRVDDPNIDRVAHRTEDPNLRIVSSGPLPPNPAELLGSERMRQLIERFAAQADVVIIDTPPVVAVTDGAVLAREVDGTLFVVRASRTKRAAIRSGRAALDRVGAKVIGTVMNGMGAGEMADEYLAQPYPARSGQEA